MHAAGSGARQEPGGAAWVTRTPDQARKFAKKQLGAVAGGLVFLHAAMRFHDIVRLKNPTDLDVKRPRRGRPIVALNNREPQGVRHLTILG
jgi:hypothetical protein